MTSQYRIAYRRQGKTNNYLASIEKLTQQTNKPLWLVLTSATINLPETSDCRQPLPLAQLEIKLCNSVGVLRRDAERVIF